MVPGIYLKASMVDFDEMAIACHVRGDRGSASFVFGSRNQVD
jgi:hypothetical protein